MHIYNNFFFCAVKRLTDQKHLDPIFYLLDFLSIVFHNYT